MSGSTIGGVVGAVIGFYVGGPQGAMLGWTIGSGVGAYVDPQKIEGPRLKDATKQTSQDGVPIPFGYGSFPTTGNLIWTDRLVETKSSKRQGKGGPKVTEYIYTRSYAVGVCEGEIGGFLIIKRNGKIVYDTRTSAELAALGYTSEQIAESRAAQAKWLAVAKLYYGDEAQTPDPTMSAVKGAGNVPSYRGLAYIVCTHEDLTEERGAVPQYEFVVSACGTRTEVGAPGDERFMAFGVAAAGFRAISRPLDVDIDLVGPADADVYGTNSTTSFGFAVFGGKAFSATKTGLCAVAELTALDTWAIGPTGSASSLNGSGLITTAGKLWQAAGTAGVKYLNTPADASFQTIASFGGEDISCVVGVGGGVIAVSKNAKIYAAASGTTFALANDIYLPAGMQLNSDSLASNGARMIAVGFRYVPVVEYTDDMGATFTSATFPATGSPLPLCARFCGGTRWLVGCDARTASTGLFMSTDNAVTFTAVTLPHIIDIAPGGIAIDGVSGRCVVYGNELGTGTNRGYWTEDYATWNVISFTGTEAQVDVFALYPPESYTAPVGDELPDAPGHYVDDEGTVTGPGGTVVERCTPELGLDIVTDLCARREVTDIDVSDLTDLVDGFKVATETDPGTAIDATRAAYFYDVSEYDGIVHFPKRGGAVSFALTMDDLAARDGDPIEWERVQEAELLRKVTVGYIDPDTTYTTTTQKWERRTGTVEAKGEASVEIPLVGRKDFAAQVAEKRGKAAWAETEKVRFSLPYKWAKLTTADVGTLTDALGKVHRIRILSIEDDGGYRHIEAVLEQTNTYVSTAAGTSGPMPTVPGTGLAGPTVAAVMNLPVLRDADDKAGLYIAAAGMLAGWQGALVQLSRNGSTYENGPVIAANATMGNLSAVLPVASAYAPDNTNTLSVTLLPTSGDLSSCTFQDLLDSEVNACAILYPDGTAEILQFQTATETAPSVYDLTGLLRGRKDTTIAEHAAGARFVLLDENIRFTPIRADDIGKTLTIRPVSIGTPEGSNNVQTIALTTIESLREWQPYNITTEDDGSGGYCFSWIGRARLGSDAYPVHSQFFDGYSLRLTDGVVIHDIDTEEQSVCVDSTEMTAIFGGGYSQPAVSVVAKSTSSQQTYNGAAPTGWVALSGTWVEDPPGTYVLQADGSSQGLMYYETPYAFASGTFNASVDVSGPLLAGFGGLTVDFMDAAGIAFITENGSPTLSVTAASLAPFGTVASARVYLRALSGSPIPAPVYFSNLLVSVTP